MFPFVFLLFLLFFTLCGLFSLVFFVLLFLADFYASFRKFSKVVASFGLFSAGASFGSLLRRPKVHRGSPSAWTLLPFWVSWCLLFGLDSLMIFTVFFPFPSVCNLNRSVVQVPGWGMARMVGASPGWFAGSTSTKQVIILVINYYNHNIYHNIRYISIYT